MGNDAKAVPDDDGEDEACALRVPDAVCDWELENDGEPLPLRDGRDEGDAKADTVVERDTRAEREDDTDTAGERETVGDRDARAEAEGLALAAGLRVWEPLRTDVPDAEDERELELVGELETGALLLRPEERETAFETLKVEHAEAFADALGEPEVDGDGDSDLEGFVDNEAKLLADDVTEKDEDGVSDTETADEALVLEETLGNGLRETVVAPDFDAADGDALRDAKDTVTKALEETLELRVSDAEALTVGDTLPLLRVDVDGRAL